MASQTDKITSWINRSTLAPTEMDCITAVMLKILDGKCKMPEHEKVTMESLYRLSKHLPGYHLTDTYHKFIAPFLEDHRDNLEESKTLEIYETRVLAETQISRPVMKKFKSRLRQEGILPKKN